jgi:hypothetical protein
MSMVNLIGRQMDDVARQRDHNQLVDMMACILNEVRERRSSMTSETPEMDEATPKVSLECLIVWECKEFNVW